MDDTPQAVARRAVLAARLYFVCDAAPRPSLEVVLRSALEGGVDLIQLRDKALDDRGLISAASTFRDLASEFGVPFVLNDRPDLVAACGADGVHVGQDDTPVALARELAGAAAIVGLSTHSAEELRAACEAEGDSRPDYLSVGPVWPTPTKEGRPATGLDYVRLAAEGAALPWFAIGGIDLSNVGEVTAAGARRIVVVRAIRDASEVRLAAAALSEHLTVSTDAEGLHGPSTTGDGQTEARAGANAAVENPSGTVQ